MDALKLGMGIGAIDARVHVAEDEFQSLLAQEYQRLQRLGVSHYHACVGCGVTLICCCQDRRQVDRLTGRARRLLCVGCGEGGGELEAT